LNNFGSHLIDKNEHQNQTGHNPQRFYFLISDKYNYQRDRGGRPNCRFRNQPKKMISERTMPSIDSAYNGPIPRNYVINKLHIK
ncbi:MAG: hypothetical protein J6U57_05445, partial [Bacteroidales bacterium]|nr:hypothetical protein [Bacteroidales bacterium]